MKFLVAVVTGVLQWALEKLWAFVSAAVTRYQRLKKIDDEAQASVQPLKDGKTGAEIDQASDSALNRW